MNAITGHARPLNLTVLVAVAAAVGLGGPVLGYSLKSYTWSTRQAPYYVNPANLDVAEGAAEAAVRAGADTWGTQSQADFEFVYAGSTTNSTVTANGRSEVFFRNEENGSVIATTYSWYSGTAILEFDIKFWDGGKRFFTGSSGCSSGYYIEDVAAHEFGHGLGLNHSDVSGATMASSISGCSMSFRTLHTDDIAGVEALYPPAGAVPAPAAPGGLTAAASASTPSSAIDLAWTDASSNEDTFIVERSTDGVNFVERTRTAANAIRYADAGLSASTSYTYRVRASNSGGFSGYSNVATATTAAPTQPAVPTNPTPGNGNANVNMDADLGWGCAGATSYDVYFGTSSSPALYASGVASPTLALPRMTAGTRYYWRVVARNASGSTSSANWSFTTRTKGRK